MPLNDAVILTAGYDVFADMMRLTYPRMSAYARAYKTDLLWQHGYQHHEQFPQRQHGMWEKIYLMRQALMQGYKYIHWIDADACVWDFDTDLRDALKNTSGFVGACLHNAHGIPPHYNVGVVYLKNEPGALEFIDAWLAGYPGSEQWAEQAVFNDLVKKLPPGNFVPLDDRWNSTIDTNEVANPAVIGWHGIFPVLARFIRMKADLYQDYLKYRIL